MPIGPQIQHKSILWVFKTKSLTVISQIAAKKLNEIK